MGKVPAMSDPLQDIAPSGEPDRVHRHIRSFVLRQGRVSSAQLRYHEAMMAEIGIPYVAAPHNLATVFGRSAESAPKILEIGFGMGETSARIAAANPQNDYLGIDQGPIVIMAANYRHDTVWKVMRQSPVIRRGLERAGFTGGWLG